MLKAVICGNQLARFKYCSELAVHEIFVSFKTTYMSVIQFSSTVEWK